MSQPYVLLTAAILKGITLPSLCMMFVYDICVHMLCFMFVCMDWFYGLTDWFYGLTDIYMRRDLKCACAFACDGGEYIVQT